MDTVLPIEQMPNLTNRLGKAGIAKIKYLDLPEREKSPRERITQNTVLDLLQGYKFKTLPADYHDVVIGNCRAVSAGTKPLDPDCLIAILQTITELSTQEIQRFLDCSASNARKYLQASKLTISFIHKINQKKVS